MAERHIRRELNYMLRDLLPWQKEILSGMKEALVKLYVELDTKTKQNYPLSELRDIESHWITSITSFDQMSSAMRRDNAPLRLHKRTRYN